MRRPDPGLVRVPIPVPSGGQNHLPRGPDPTAAQPHESPRAHRTERDADAPRTAPRSPNRAVPPARRHGHPRPASRVTTGALGTPRPLSQRQLPGPVDGRPRRHPAGSPRSPRAQSAIAPGPGPRQPRGHGPRGRGAVPGRTPRPRRFRSGRRLPAGVRPTSGLGRGRAAGAFPANDRVEAWTDTSTGQSRGRRSPVLPASAPGPSAEREAGTGGRGRSPPPRLRCASRPRPLLVGLGGGQCRPRRALPKMQG